MECGQDPYSDEEEDRGLNIVQGIGTLNPKGKKKVLDL
jgi:hypothetical protein